MRLLLTLILFGTAACGVDQKYDVVQVNIIKVPAAYYESGIPYYNDIETLPTCTSDNEGDMAYWDNTKAYYNCLKGSWYRLN